MDKKAGFFFSPKRSKNKLEEDILIFFFTIILNLFILNSIHLYLMPWFIPIKNKEGKAIYLQSALPLQKGHIKYNVAPNEAYRLQNFVLNIGKAMCIDLKKIL